MNLPRWWRPVLTIAAVLAIGWFTLQPSPGDTAPELIPFSCLYGCGDELLRDAVLNLLLFLPFGVSLGLWGRWQWTHAVLFGLLLSGSVELCQFLFLVGRDASLRDLLTNTTGTLLGYHLVAVAGNLWRPDRRRAGWLTALALSGWLLLLLAGARGIRPALPDSVYWGQWAPDLGQFEPWEGTLLDARLNGIEVPNGRLGDTTPFRRMLLGDTALVSARILTGSMPEGQAAITSMFDGEQREIYVLGQDHGDLIFRLRTRLVDAGLRGQTIRLADALALPAGEPALLIGGIRDRAWVLRVVSRSDSLEWRLPWSAALLWNGLTPYAWALGRSTALLDGLWLALLLFPLGFWSTGVFGKWGPLMTVAGAAGLGLGLLVPLAGLPLPPASEWAGALSGGVGGVLLGGWARRPQRGS